MKMPANMPVRAVATVMGKTRVPDARGDDPFTDWK